MSNGLATTHKGVARLVAAALLPAAASAALVPLRKDVDNATTALALAVVVLGVGMLGGRRPAVVAAVSAALSFDLLHAEPYGSFAVRSGDDLLKTALLLLVGLSSATSVARRAEAEATVEERRHDLQRVREVTRVAERSPEALAEQLELELVRLLDIHSAAFEPGPGHSQMPRITETGIRVPAGTPPIDPRRRETWAVELPVCAGPEQLGRFVLQLRHPSSGVDLPQGRRDLALTWADQLGLALSPPGTAPLAPRGATAREP